MQRIVPRIVLEPPRTSSPSKNNYSHHLDNIGTFVASDSDSDSDNASVASESARSVVSTVPSEYERAGKSDQKLMKTLINRASSRSSANKILEKFGQDYFETLPADLLEEKSPLTGQHVSPSKQQRFTCAELGSIQDVLVRYESKAFDLLARGRHDKALQTCKQLRALIRRLANEGIVDHHGSVAGAGCGEKGSSILLQLYAMAVESEAYFLNGKLLQAKKKLMAMDAALEQLASTTDQPLSQLPRAVRCAVACYTMLGNLFSLEARRMRLKTNQQQSIHSNHNVSQHSLLVSSYHSSHQSTQQVHQHEKQEEETYNATLDLSVQAFRHAVKLRKQEGGNPGFGHTLLGEVLVAQGNFVEATSELQQALDCAQRFGDGLPIQERRNLGDVLLIRNNYAASLEQYVACVRAMALDLKSVVVGCPAWRIEMLAQASVCATLSTVEQQLRQRVCHAVCVLRPLLLLAAIAEDGNEQPQRALAHEEVLARDRVHLRSERTWVGKWAGGEGPRRWHAHVCAPILGDGRRAHPFRLGLWQRLPRLLEMDVCDVE